MDTTSVWRDTATMPRCPRLDRDLEVDVVVVGAGITGITAAYLFKRAGRTVALVERERLGGVDTAHTTAHLTHVTDRRLHELAQDFGKAQAKAVWDAGTAAIDTIASIVRTEAIKCGFSWVPAFLHTPPGPLRKSDLKALEDDASLAQELGFAATFLPEIPYLDVPGVRFAGQALFHPLKYLGALARLIPGKGSHVFEHTAVSEVTESPLTVCAEGHEIRTRYVVLATHTPLTGATGMVSALLFQTKLYLYTTYAIGAEIPRGVVPEGSFWDTADPYHYLRVDRRRGSDYAILGGEDHKTGQARAPAERYRRLEAALRAMIPGAKVDHRWSGQVVETNDGLPFIGETAPNQFAATGFAGNGMTFGTLGAMMAVDTMAGRSNPWQDLFAPTRKKIRGGLLTYLAENKDYPYYLVRDRLAGAQASSLRAVRRNQGKIVNLDGKKVAAYRDENGAVTLCSPICTHLGCVVAWNDAERTWDCPCHGSRFTASGEVMSGPAEEPLERLPDPSAKTKG